jgi:tritrans,polycis-undecaprenyl-diphosphate synthase [geranylgeranyl-diphosphate specific]
MNLRDLSSIIYERFLKWQVLQGPSINHVAVIQDGNRRYAREHGLSRMMGHDLGAKSTERVSEWCVALGIKHLTVYAFSTENFRRSQEEQSYLFDLFTKKLLELCRSPLVHKNQVRVRAIGRTELLPLELQKAIDQVEEVTKSYDKMYMNIAMAYGGQGEIVDAARALALEVKAGRLTSQEINEDLIEMYLYPHNDLPVPEVDLIIRTGGEVRTSNFLPWQANGNECAAYFCAPYWPEFRMIDFLRAIRTAQARRSQANQQA